MRTSVINEISGLIANPMTHLPTKPRRREDMGAVALDINVYNALREYASLTGGQLKGYASLAVAQWLRERGVALEYPVKNPKAAA